METFARMGERAGTAVGSGVRVARKTAVRAGRQLAEQMPDHTAKLTKNARQAKDTAQAALVEHWGPALEVLAERWGVTQDVLADRLREARHELATRIDPEPPQRRRRRWPWLILLLLAIAGSIGAVVLARRPQEIEPEPFPPPPAREPGSRDSDPDATGTPASNGAVGVERPSASTD